MSCCLGCVVQPASTKQRKTYNILVPALFAGEPIKLDDPLDSTLRRKIQKLQEYVQKNPAKIPKVSRRLMRCIRSTLLKPGDNLGHVKVAVLTYTYLLAMSLDEVSSYSPGFFARELVTGQDAVVPALLRDGHIGVRTLGAELLAVLTHAQTGVDAKLDALLDMTPLVCKAARGALAATAADAKVQQAEAKRAAGDRLALPNPLDLLARQDPAKVELLEACCLRALQELLLLCRRAGGVLPRHLVELEGVVMDNLRARRGDGVDGAEQSPKAASASAAPAATPSPATPPGGAVDWGFYDVMGVAMSVPAGTRPAELARAVLRLLADFTRDMSTVHALMDSLYLYLDEHHRWQEPTMQQVLLQVLGGTGDLSFPVYASVMRHAAAPQLAPADAAAVVSVAATLAVRLDAGYALSALALALRELPRTWAAQAKRSPQRLPIQAVLDLFKPGGGAAAPAVASRPQRTSSVDSAAVSTSAAVAGSSPAPSAVSTAQLAPAPAAGATGAAPAPQDAASFQEQLAALKAQLLSATAAMAARVATAGELAEAISVGLRTGGSGGGSGSGSGGGLGAGGAAAAGPSLADAMAIECCAAAAEAAGPGYSGEGAWQLPGEVLPTDVVAPLLPVLQSWPPVLCRDAYAVLAKLAAAAARGFKSQADACDVLAAMADDFARPGHPPGPADRSPPSLAAADALLLAALRTTAGAAAPPHRRPEALLAAAQLALQQRRGWADAGYLPPPTGGGGAAPAAGCVLLHNALLAALADALATLPLAAKHHLPVGGDAAPPLEVRAGRLFAAAPAWGPTSDAAAATALAALERAVPSAACAEALQVALAGVPSLRQAYGAERLTAALQQQRRAPSAGSSASPDGKPAAHFQERMNRMLVHRMSTLRKDLVHVSELIKRDSLQRIVQPPPSPSSLVHPGASGAGVDDGAGDGTAAYVRSDSGTLLTSAARAAASAKPAAALAAEEGGGGGGAGGEEVDVERLLAAGMAGGGPPPYVVGDVQISRLAGQLEPLLR